MTLKFFNRTKRVLTENRLISFFIFIHTIFAIFLGRLFAFAPDEAGYLYTFNNIYGNSTDPNAQYSSGWIATPKIFLWIAYLPAKVINIIGVPDYLSIRLLSILLAAFSLYLLKGILDRSMFGRQFSQKFIFIVFFIPSIFLWTSIGLRESFILAEMTFFLIGLNFLVQEKNKQAFILLFTGSFGLLSTKNYLWVCLMAALILACVIFVFQGLGLRKIRNLLIVAFILPTLVFTSTSSVYALSFIFQTNISSVGERSGDSITQVYVDVTDGGNATDGGNGREPSKELLIFHGDYTLIALHFYLLDNPNSLFSKTLQVFGLEKKVQSLWDEKVRAGSIRKDEVVAGDTSSLNGHIVKPGQISNPLSMFWPALIFLFGPIPFVGDPGIAIGITSLESPMWWTLYTLVFIQFIRFRRVRFLQDPTIVFTLVFLTGLIAFSSLVEVNLGTSFRHRSIILVPLVFIFVRLAQRAKEQKDLEL